MTTDMKIVPNTGNNALTDAERRERIDRDLFHNVEIRVQRAKDALRAAQALANQIHSPHLKDVANFKIAEVYT
jgi:hypothetical protein